jgi:hypothetical protein
MNSRDFNVQSHGTSAIPYATWGAGLKLLTKKVEQIRE